MPPQSISGQTAKKTGKETYLISAVLKETKQGLREGVSAPEPEGVFKPVSQGLPFFGQTWNYLVAFAWMKKDFGPTDEYIERATKSLHEYDFESTRRYYQCVRSDDYAAEIDGVEARLRMWDSRVPSGYLRVQLAALKARHAPNIGDALVALDGTQLGANDFPWLADVVTVHRAWAYSRSGDATGEATEIERLLTEQPMLFEPDHAVSFAFLPYRKALKPRYQNKLNTVS